MIQGKEIALELNPSSESVLTLFLLLTTSSSSIGFVAEAIHKMLQKDSQVKTEI